RSSSALPRRGTASGSAGSRRSSWKGRVARTRPSFAVARAGTRRSTSAASPPPGSWSRSRSRPRPRRRCAAPRSPQSPPELTLRSRELAWEGCLNVRDLGGLPTEDGGQMRYGQVVRADSVRQLTDAGWKAVADYGVRTVVDLR